MLSHEELFTLGDMEIHGEDHSSAARDRQPDLAAAFGGW
jgi:hypothetical protein